MFFEGTFCLKYLIFVQLLLIFVIIILLEVLILGANVFRRLEAVHSFLEDEPTVEAFRLEAFKRLRSFVYEGSFSGYNKKDLLCKTAFWSEDKASKALDLKPVSLRRLRSQYTDACLSVIGEDAFDKIMFGSFKDVAILMQLCSTYSKTKSLGVSSLFPQELVSLIERSTLDENAVYLLEDCKAEMTLLHWLSILKYAELINAVDVDKLNYLLRVLDGECGKSSDRVLLMQLLTCDSPERHCPEEEVESYKFPPDGYVPEDKMSLLSEEF